MSRPENVQAASLRYQVVLCYVVVLELRVGSYLVLVEFLSKYEAFSLAEMIKTWRIFIRLLSIWPITTPFSIKIRHQLNESTNQDSWYDKGEGIVEAKNSPLEKQTVAITCNYTSSLVSTL